MLFYTMQDCNKWTHIDRRVCLLGMFVCQLIPPGKDNHRATIYIQPVFKKERQISRNTVRFFSNEFDFFDWFIDLSFSVYKHCAYYLFPENILRMAECLVLWGERWYYNDFLIQLILILKPILILTSIDPGLRHPLFSSPTEAHIRLFGIIPVSNLIVKISDADGHLVWILSRYNFEYWC